MLRRRGAQCYMIIGGTVLVRNVLEGFPRKQQLSSGLKKERELRRQRDRRKSTSGREDGICKSSMTRESTAYWRNWKEVSVADAQQVRESTQDEISGERSGYICRRMALPWYPDNSMSLYRPYPRFNYLQNALWSSLGQVKIGSLVRRC